MKRDVIRFTLVGLMLAGTWAEPFSLSVAETESMPRLDFLKKFETYEKKPVANTAAAEHAKTLVAQHGKIAFHAMIDAKQKTRWSDELAIEVARALASQYGIDLEQRNGIRDKRGMKR